VTTQLRHFVSASRAHAGVTGIALLTATILVTACSSGPLARSASNGAPGATDGGEHLDGRLLAMVDRRERDTLLVDSLFRVGTSGRRARAALAVGQVQMRERFGLLRRLLIDSDTAVAASAAFALGIGHDSGAVSALARVVVAAPEPVAREAAWALGELGDAARAALGASLGEGDAQPLVRSPAAQRSGLVRGELLQATVKLKVLPLTVVTPWLSDTAIEAVRGAAYAIARPRVLAGARPMLALATHRDELVRQYVARTLARTSVGDSLVARARSALGSLVADSSARVRANAARSLGTYGAVATADMRRALADPDVNVRVAALENIGTVFSSDGDAWRQAWARDSTHIVRQTLLVSARRAQSDALAKGETEWASSGDWRQRLAALDARLADRKADRAALARGAAMDQDGRVRAAALAAITPALAGTPDVRPLLKRALTDPDAQVRAVATSSLGRQASAEDLSEVITSWTMSQRVVDEDARTAALRFIASAWQRDSVRVPANLRSRLSALAAPASRAERALVGRVTPLAAWQRAPGVESPRPLADYNRIARAWLRGSTRKPVALVHTERGDITLELYSADAPLVVDAFIRLAREGYYRDTWFHRVVPNFVAQDGNPRGDGSGGPGFTVRDALTRRRHERGAVGLATAGPDTGGAQYYLCHSAQPHLDGHYTVLGRVVSGADIMDQLVQGDRVRSVEIR